MIKIVLLFFSILFYSYAHDTQAILEKLTHFKTDKRALHVKYSPFKVDTLPSKIKSSPVSSALSTSEWTLKAIFNQKAFINDSWYKVGQSVGKYRVKSIYDTGIVLENGKIIKTLKLDTSKMYLHVKEK